MSGGKWNYDQYRITDIADCIENEIKNNNIKKDDYDYPNNFSSETLNLFRDGVRALRIAQVYAQRIDWLLSCDDNEESFIERLKTDLSELR